ncbi:unnamed protein product [Polarella glacialis]|uniref:Methyltransferase type 11 domain-containing protein n=1 Tax=Polarella glacialis TaxID=89957 RepID=A0A813HWK4_POLGL|nr:unnamed protein product [Polarella glacialis]
MSKDLFHTDIHASNIPGRSIDLIICIFVFEHLRRPWQALGELWRILAFGGQVLWVVPFWQEMHNVPGDYFRFTGQGARSMAEDAGFQIAKFATLGAGGTVDAGRTTLTGAWLLGSETLFQRGSVRPSVIAMLLDKKTVGTGNPEPPL